MAEKPTSKPVSPTGGTTSPDTANQNDKPTPNAGGAGGGSGGGGGQLGTTTIIIKGDNSNVTIIINNGDESEVTTESPDSKQLDKAQSNGKDSDKLVSLLKSFASAAFNYFVREVYNFFLNLLK